MDFGLTATMTWWQWLLMVLLGGFVLGFAWGLGTWLAGRILR